MASAYLHFRSACSGIQTREFTADGLYATEEEADLHGMTFGQRIVDGKVEGLAVWDLKSQDRRITPRFRVQFRTTFSAAPTLVGTGSILDLSAGDVGWKVRRR